VTSGVFIDTYPCVALTYGCVHTKLDASSVLPVPLYFAIFGKAHSGRVLSGSRSLRFGSVAERSFPFSFSAKAISLSKFNLATFQLASLKTKYRKYDATKPNSDITDISAKCGAHGDVGLSNVLRPTGIEIQEMLLNAEPVISAISERT
jgi:hypothetical protein